MARVIEEQVFKCKKCNRLTKHFRNNNKSSGFMIMVHVLLTLGTLGVWLVLVIIWKILTAKIGGWKCGECGS